MPSSRFSRACRAVCAAGLCCGLLGCAARTPVASAVLGSLGPVSTIVAMGMGPQGMLGALGAQAGDTGQASGITPGEQAHFEALNCAGLHEMAGVYTPSGTGLPASSTSAMQAVAARQALLARLQSSKGC